MYVIMLLYLCMYIFYITLARKNGLGRLPEYNNQSINQSLHCVHCMYRNVAIQCFVLDPESELVELKLEQPDWLHICTYTCLHVRMCVTILGLSQLRMLLK